MKFKLSASLFIVVVLAVFLTAILISGVGNSLSAVFSKCKEEQLKFAENNFSVEVSKFSSSMTCDRTVLIMPPTGGKNSIDVAYAKLLCAKGFQVFIFDTWTTPAPSIDLDLHQRIYESAQHAIGLVISKIEKGFVGILGTSVGGLYSTTAMSQQSRLSAGFVIACGEPIAAVITQSDQEAMLKLKRERLDKFHFKSQEDYQTELLKHIQLDAFILPKNFVGKKLGMAIALQDKTVPTALQFNLEKLWNPQTVLKIEGEHFGAIVKTWLFHSREIVDFFSEAADLEQK